MESCYPALPALAWQLSANFSTKLRRDPHNRAGCLPRNRRFGVRRGCGRTGEAGRAGALVQAKRGPRLPASRYNPGWEKPALATGQSALPFRTGEAPEINIG